MPPGTPLPPARASNRHSTSKWADWIAKYLLPKYGVGSESDDSNVFLKAAKAKAQREIDEAAMAKLDRQVAEGTYQSAELFRANIRFLATVINSAITTFVEKGIAEKLIAASDAWNLTAEQRLALHPLIHAACQSAADELRESLRKALAEAVHKAQ